MARTHSFSIFLLKEGFDASNALKDDHELDAVAPSELPVGSSLFLLDAPPKPPWWKGYFGVEQALMQSTKGALVFLPVGDRTFALSFGHVFHNLKDTSYEYDFGLRVTLNCVDPDALKNTDVFEPGTARRQRTQVPIGRDLTYFDFDRDSKVLRSLTGKAKPQYEHLIKNATGASNLRISSPVTAAELPALCEQLLALYNDDAFRNVFPDIQNIVPVKDPATIAELNERLLEALREQSADLYLTLPAIINYQDSVHFTFTGLGPSDIYDDAYLGRYYQYLAQNGCELTAVEIAHLRKHQLHLATEDGLPREGWAIYKCLVFDTTNEETGETFHFAEGQWYRVSIQYVEKLEEDLDPYCCELTLPEYTHNRESEYNAAVAAGDDNYLCLDMENIGPQGQTQVEPCDLYAVHDDHAVLHHVKVSTFSQDLSHLFNQGTNSVELLKGEPASLERLREIVTEHSSDEKQEGFLAPLGKPAFRVVFVIVTHKDKARKSKNLPLFSRISLRRNLKALRLMDVDATYGFVTHNKPSAPGKKKPKKKKGGVAAA